MELNRIRKLASELYTIPDQIDAARTAAKNAEARLAKVHDELRKEAGGEEQYEALLMLLREQALLGADWQRAHLCPNHVGLGVDGLSWKQSRDVPEF